MFATSPFTRLGNILYGIGCAMALLILAVECIRIGVAGQDSSVGLALLAILFAGLAWLTGRGLRFALAVR